jgi:hypothetical protein
MTYGVFRVVKTGAIMDTKLKYLFAVGMMVAGGWTLPTMAQNAQSMEGKDPARWYKEDTTPQARYQTSKKEAAAAYRENTAQCKELPKADRSACLKEARDTYRNDLKLAKEMMSNPTDSASGR